MSVTSEPCSRAVRSLDSLLSVCEGEVYLELLFSFALPPEVVKKYANKPCTRLDSLTLLTASGNCSEMLMLNIKKLPRKKDLLRTGDKTLKLRGLSLSLDWTLLMIYCGFIRFCLAESPRH
jgi:hypothetical protein